MCETTLFGVCGTWPRCVKQHCLVFVWPDLDVWNYSLWYWCELTEMCETTLIGVCANWPRCVKQHCLVFVWPDLDVWNNSLWCLCELTEMCETTLFGVCVDIDENEPFWTFDVSVLSNRYSFVTIFGEKKDNNVLLFQNPLVTLQKNSHNAHNARVYAWFLS